MSSGVIDKYLQKKKKDLLDYSKELENIITIETNTLWDTKQNFINHVKEIIDYYVEHYYFDNNIHRDNPIEYSNDNINSVLFSMIEYCKNTNQANLLKEKKNETFLMSVIVCTACYVDIATNVVDGNYRDAKEKFKYLLQHLQKTNILKIYINNKPSINRLFEKIRDNNHEEDKFFNSFVSENFYNEYRLYTKEQPYYMVDYKYKVDGLETYDSKMVNAIKREYEDKFLGISYELLVIDLLKEYISNNEIKHYLIPISSSIIKKVNNFKIFDDDKLKKYLSIIVKFEDREKYLEYINKLKDFGLECVYEYSDINETGQNTFLRNMNVMVSEEFLSNNEDKLYYWKNQGVNFIVKNIEEDVR